MKVEDSTSKHYECEFGLIFDHWHCHGPRFRVFIEDFEQIKMVVLSDEDPIEDDNKDDNDFSNYNYISSVKNERQIFPPGCRGSKK